MSMPPPERWPSLDGTAVSCREKLKMLGENWHETGAVLRDTFEDAVLMGVDEAGMRQLLHAMIDALESPRRNPSAAPPR